MAKTKKERLYELYAKGYKPDTPEAKKVAPKYSTRISEYSRWKSAGMPGYVGEIKAEPDLTPPLPLEHSEGPPNGKPESGKPPPTVNITDASFRVSPKDS